MKIKKIEIKKYKMFDDLTLDFTDINGNPLDVIVIAGINGSGKTSLLQLLRKLFSASSNVYPVKQALIDFEKEPNAIICESINLDVQISEENFLDINDFITTIRNISDAKVITRIPLFRKKDSKNILSYSLEKKGKNFFITHNDFLPFVVLPPNKMFNIWYFVANHLDLGQNQHENKHSNKDIIHDGIVSLFDIFSLSNTVDDYIVESIKQSLLQNREQTGQEAIKKRINEINQLLHGISLQTKLVDVADDKPIFETFNGKVVSLADLSSGEKQLYYRATLLSKLNPQNSLIMVDEPENSLHPTWQREVVKLYQNAGSNNQVILATHSPHIIASVDPKNLFLLYINEETHQIECINAAKAHLHSKGVEPNRILREIMDTPLRDADTQARIDKVADVVRLQPDKVADPENLTLINDLIADLGGQDPFILRLTHQLNVLEAKK